MSEVSKNPTGLAFSADGRFLMVLGFAEDTTTTMGVVIDVETGMVDPDCSGPAAGRRGMGADGVRRSPTSTNDRENDENPGGLFVSAAPGEPGRLLIGDGFNAVDLLRQRAVRLGRATTPCSSAGPRTPRQPCSTSSWGNRRGLNGQGPLRYMGRSRE